VEEIVGINLDASFDIASRTLKMEIRISEAKDVWSHFEEKTVASVTEDFDKKLLNNIDRFFQEGSFILMYFYENEEDDEYSDEIPEKIHDEVEKNIDGEIASQQMIGRWSYTRKDRISHLIWNTPDWFVDHCSKEIEDTEGVMNVCRDWFINSY
jgi:hypothetical protein|tara:strand:- start:34 stop:495 length:462 start_codon:yes stop_codon:yes gene_type:complete